MKYLVLIVLICGCQAQTVPMEPLRPHSQPTWILVLPPESPSEPVWSFEVPGTYRGAHWECVSKHDCPGGLVCCGQADLGSNCRDYCDPGLVSTICEADDECKKELSPGAGPFPEMDPDAPLCIPMKDGPPDVKVCALG